MISLEKWFEIEATVIYQVKTLDFSNKEITELPSLTKYKNLTRLICNNNKLKKLPELPENLKYLDIRNNNIEFLPSRLPKKLRSLNCENNNIKRIPDELPPSLKILICNYNPIIRFPPLNNTRLVRFECMNNNINYLYNLPSCILVLNFWGNQLYEDPFLIGPFKQKKIWINGMFVFMNKGIDNDEINIYFTDSDKSSISW